MTEAVTLFSRLIKSQQNNSETLPNTMPTKLRRGKANKSKEALEKTKEKINEKKDEIGEIELQKIYRLPSMPIKMVLLTRNNKFNRVRGTSKEYRR
jgi:hypothetical protein